MKMLLIQGSGVISLRIAVIIQARMESTRLPQKVLMNLCGKPVLWHIINRVKYSNKIDDVIVATSDHKSDDEIEKFALSYNIKCFRGSHNNVLERYYKCASHYKADIIVRLTGDNALVDFNIIDEGIGYFKKTNADYMYYREGLPLGMAVEIFKFKTLKEAYENATDKECLEHVTPYMSKNPDRFNSLRVKCIGDDNSDLRWTMDTEEDYKLIKDIYEALYKEGKVFSYDEVLEEYKDHDNWREMNTNIRQIEILYKGEKLC